VDPVALHEDEALHLRIPATRLVPEMDARLEQLLHGDDRHVVPLSLRPYLRSPSFRLRRRSVGPFKTQVLACSGSGLPYERVKYRADRRDPYASVPRDARRTAGPSHRDRVRVTGMAWGVRRLVAMARYDERPVPRGTSGRWEVVLADEERGREPARALTALDVRADHRILQDLPDDDLAGIPLLAEGTQLRRYNEYLDLHDPGRANFLAEGTEIVRPGQRIVARKSVSKGIWDDLLTAMDAVTGRRRRRSA
jgi:hypothetical protein